VEKTMRKELEMLNEQKTEFLYSIAHELKTPLTAIIASAELLGEGTFIPDDLKERMISSISRGALSMDRRVTELLYFAKVEVGQMQIKPEPLDLGIVVNEVVSQLNILFEQKEQGLILEIPGSLPKVNADPERLKQVLFNLLSNANKFSPVKSVITLRVRAVSRKVIIEVEDSAPALRETEKAKIFDPYYRGEDAEKRERYPGLGLGLFICRRILELHQGEIWVETKPGKGNTFCFSLPTLNQRMKGIG
ncbi:sensor histidine kinase, partial [Chloroflexota bacterium]